eukprot:15021527-Alexandrium_andersonii.AAC.1
MLKGASVVGGLLLAVDGRGVALGVRGGGLPSGEALRDGVVGHLARCRRNEELRVVGVELGVDRDDLADPHCGQGRAGR